MKPEEAKHSVLEEEQLSCGSYDLMTVYAANTGRGRFEDILFNSSAQNLNNFCNDLLRWVLVNFGSKEMGLLNGGHEKLFDVLMSVSRLGVERYHALGAEERRSLFDLEPVAIDELGEFEVDDILWEGGELVEVLLAERGEIEDVQVLMRKMAEECVWDGQGGQEGEVDEEIEAWKGRLVVNKDIVDDVQGFFVILVDFLKARGVLDYGLSYEKVLFDEESFNRFADGVRGVCKSEAVVCHSSFRRVSISEKIEHLLTVLGKIRSKKDVGEGFSKREIKKMAVPYEPLSEVIAYDLLSDLGRKRLFGGIQNTGFWSSGSSLKKKDYGKRPVRRVAVPEYEVEGFPEPISLEESGLMNEYDLEKLGGTCAVVFCELIKFVNDSIGFLWSRFNPYDVIFSPEVQVSFREKVEALWDDENECCMAENGDEVLDDLFARMEALSFLDEDMWRVFKPETWLILTVEQVKLVSQVFDAVKLEEVGFWVGIQGLKVDSLEEMEAVRDKKRGLTRWGIDSEGRNVQLADECPESSQPLERVEYVKVGDPAAMQRAIDCSTRRKIIPKWIQDIMLRFEWGRKLLISNNPSSDDNCEEGSQNNSDHPF